MAKFAHIADTHIRNLKYHYEYREVFEKMYERLREEKVDYIIHCGDIAHTKTQISPEFVQMASDFFRQLSSIAPTYVILGNHDGNLKNRSRQDALTPIIDALDLPDLHLLKDAGETHIDDVFSLNVLSVFDEDEWVKPSDASRINIALYHGSVRGVVTDTGYIMEHGDHDINIFEGHDFAFLGDIHKTNQSLDPAGRVRYPGSTVQQNHGESNDKGLLLWEINGKDDFSCEHVVLQNPKPFVTIELTPKGRIPKGTVVPIGARIRIVTNNNLTIDSLKKAVDVAKRRFSPESITFLNRACGSRGGPDVTGEFNKEDLRDLNVQARLIKEYIKDYEPDTQTVKKVLELNKHYSTLVEEEELVKRNIKWGLKSLKWDNLFNYGSGNSINFSEISGVVGIFGKNFSGKSSIIDSLLWGMFNSTSKNNRKTLNVINQNKEHCEAEVVVEIDGKELTISRRSDKYLKKLKGDETIEAKTNLEFNVKDPVTEDVISLNGMTRSHTDKNIRKFFGTLEDFLLTSMSSQLDSLSFIGEGSTKRKEILAKFLDLEVFDKKFKLAKEDSADHKALIKKFEDRDFHAELNEERGRLEENTKTLENQKQECNILQENIVSARTDLEETQAKIDSIPVEIIDYDAEKNRLKLAKKEMAQIRTSIRNSEKTLRHHTGDITKFEKFVSTFDADGLKDKQNIIKAKKDELNRIHGEIALHENKSEHHKKKLTLLDEVPCGAEYSHCQFIKDAYNSKEEYKAVNTALKGILAEKKETSSDIENLNPTQVESYLSKYQQVVEKLAIIRSSKSEEHLAVETARRTLLLKEAAVSELQVRIKEYEDNKESIENLEKLLTHQKSVGKEMHCAETRLLSCNDTVMSLNRTIGGIEQNIQTISNQEEELNKLRFDYSAYDLYMRCMHSNGIALDIVRKSLPVINEEIAKVLANVVDFEVLMECDGKSLNMLIKHPKYEARPLEMGSGAEKTIASMGIRMALLNISSMPKGNIFILDEPGSALDEENMEGFIRILDLVKSYYKTVLLISHLDSLKDCVDTQIVIDKKDKYAHVKQ